MLTGFLAIPYVISVPFGLMSPLLYIVYYLVAFIITLPVSPLLYTAWIVMLILDGNEPVWSKKFHWYNALAPPLTWFGPGTPMDKLNSCVISEDGCEVSTVEAVMRSFEFPCRLVFEPMNLILLFIFLEGGDDLGSWSSLACRPYLSWAWGLLWPVLLLFGPFFVNSR